MNETRSLAHRLTRHTPPQRPWFNALWRPRRARDGAAAGGDHFDEHRAFLGVDYRCQADALIRTEIGYLNQFINVQGGVERMNHILSVNFFF